MSEFGRLLALEIPAIHSRTKGGTLFAAVLLAIATIAASCDPARATVADGPSTILNKRAVTPIGWDTGGMDRNYDRSYDTSGFDRHFERNFDRNYNTTGFDRHFERNFDRNFDTNGLDLPPNTNRRRQPR